MREWLQKEKRFIVQTYRRQPIAIVDGKGAVVRDDKGRSYLDMFSGICVNNLGHCHPKVVEAVSAQTRRLMHVSNLYYTLPQIELAELLASAAGNYKSFFCNSGAEANEAAIKLARKRTGKAEIIAAENSFHGRTLATLAATGQDRYKKGFEPLPQGFVHVPYGEHRAIEKAFTGNTAAVMLEPIQGEGGVVVPPESYLKEVERLCRREGALLIIDEVQTGFGRTGSLFAWQQAGIEPDIFTLAKAMASGLPIGAMLAREEVASGFGYGDHASTFGGNPVACAAAVATLKVILEERLAERAAELGSFLLSELRRLKEKHSFVREVRGRGLLLGIELEMPCGEMVDRLREKGVLVNCTHDNVLRLAPPLVITREELERGLRALEEAFEEAS